MDRWQGKIAVVTGASSGIGRSVAEELLKSGLIVVGIARSVEKIEALKEKLPDNLKENLHALKCDISKEEEIVLVFESIDKIGQVSVLVNCAGTFKFGNLLDPDNTEKLKTVMDVNVFGTVFCVREAYQLMKKHKIDDGHIININSFLGHKIPYLSPLKIFNSSLNIYPATKHTIIALNEIWRQELMAEKSNIKITSISPGLTNTSLFGKLSKPIIKLFMQALTPTDVVGAVLYALGTAPHVQIQEISVRPIREPY